MAILYLATIKSIRINTNIELPRLPTLQRYATGVAIFPVD